LDINALNQNKFIFGETIAILFLLFDYPFGSIVLVDLWFLSPVFMILSRDFIHGINTILRYIARVATVPSFYGQDAIQAAHVRFGQLFAFLP
jgi:hypothetical protein